MQDTKHEDDTIVKERWVISHGLFLKAGTNRRFSAKKEKKRNQRRFFCLTDERLANLVGQVAVDDDDNDNDGSMVGGKEGSACACRAVSSRNLKPEPAEAGKSAHEGKSSHSQRREEQHCNNQSSIGIVVHILEHHSFVCLSIKPVSSQIARLLFTVQRQSEAPKFGSGPLIYSYYPQSTRTCR
jgi:hypothetical protein